MSRRKYPRYHGSHKLAPNTTSVCAVIGCDAQARKSVTVEFSYMRGEDECVRLCDAHASKAQVDVDGLCDNVPKEAWK